MAKRRSCFVAITASSQAVIVAIIHSIYNQASCLLSFASKRLYMIPEGPLFHKPKSFLSARQTIYASILVGVLSLIIRAASTGFTNTDGIAVTAAILVFYVVIILLVKQMSNDRKWARTAILILYILAMLAYPVVMSEQLKASMLVAALLLIQAALVIYALVLLYNTECNKWFNSLPLEK